MNLVSILNETVTKTLEDHIDQENKKRHQFEKNRLYAYLEGLQDSLIKHRVFIAGGTITSLFTGASINDIDIYFRSEQSLVDFLKEHWMDGESFVTCLTKKSVLMVKGKDPDYLNLQMIHFKYFDKAEDIFDTFDFTVCMGVFDFGTEQFVLHPDFLKHNSQRILKFNKHTAFPIVSLLRVQKYNKKHYAISKPEFIRIALKCMDLNITTIEELKDHLGGMYGINYDKIVSIDEDEEFSLDLIIDKISNIALDEDYFKKPVEIKFDDLDDIIDTVKKRPIHIINLDKKYYRIYDSGAMKKIAAKAPFFINVNAEEFFKDKRFYKWVKKIDDGKYVSHYDKNFNYEDGQISTARRDRLYFTEKQNINHSTYHRQGVLIEVSVKPEDFIDKNSYDIFAKSCTVIREVPKSEWENYLNENEDTEEKWDF